MTDAWFMSKYAPLRGFKVITADFGLRIPAPKAPEGLAMIQC